MTSPLRSLIECGTKLWLDSIDPDLVVKNRALGATGATSNPIIISDLIKTGRFDGLMKEMFGKGYDDTTVAWEMTDRLVRDAQSVFHPVWEQTKGNDGYVSFEVDPLLEDPTLGPPHAERVRSYVELGTKWAQGHQNRMIKVPATPAGLEALPALAAAGVTINCTLIFTPRQYRIARESVWLGAQERRDGTANLKSVYSIFVSRVDVYTEKQVPELSPAAQGLVGIVNAKQIWAENKAFWADKKLPREQEMIFASTGTKKPEDPPDKYVEAFAGSDIETNPPATNDAVEKLGKRYTRQVDQLPPKPVVDEIGAKTDMEKLERFLMDEGVEKFAVPFQNLLGLIAEKRKSLGAGA